MNREAVSQYAAHYLSDNFFAYHVDLYRQQEAIYPVDRYVGRSYLPLDLHLCLYCGKKGNLRCSRCKAVYFCSSSCQKRAWPLHRRHCGRDLFSVCAACGAGQTLIRCGICPAWFCSVECVQLQAEEHREEECQRLDKLFPNKQPIMLDISRGGLTSLTDCSIPPKTAAIDASGNPLVSLVGCPKTVTRLICATCGLTSLEGCPESVTALGCCNNALTSFVGAPSSLVDLDIRYNQLTSLDGCPQGITHLACDHNNLTSLKGLPPSISVLYCEENYITDLAELPFTVQELNISGNPLSEEWTGKTLEQIHALNREKKLHKLCEKMAARTIQRIWWSYWLTPKQDGEIPCAKRSYEVLMKTISHSKESDTSR